MIALVHAPPADMQACELTYVTRQLIDATRVCREHAKYCRLLAECGVTVSTLDVSSDLPDAVFVEDTAVVLDKVAVLCSMGAASRRAEPERIAPVLHEFREVLRIELPATIEGGDVLRIGRILLVGQSQRTNAAGIAVLASLAGRFGYQTMAVPVRGALHLKTACCALPDGRLLVNPAWIDAAVLSDFEQVRVPEQEPWGANIALVNEMVLLNSAHVRTAELVRSLGFLVRTTTLAEFAKAEGGITCLSLLLP